MEKVLLCTVLITSLFELTRGQQLMFPYGGNVEFIHPATDDSCDLFFVKKIIMFDSAYDKIHVCTNGLLSLNGVVNAYNPSPFPLSLSTPVLAPFWADVDLTLYGKLFAGVSLSQNVLDMGSAEVGRVFSNTFKANWALIVTWEDVVAYGYTPTWFGTNTFQAVLLMDDQDTYVMYNYERINWSYGAASLSTPAQVGFDASDGVNYYALPGSRTTAIADVELGSNVGFTGRYVFKISTPEVLIPSTPGLWIPLTTPVTQPTHFSTTITTGSTESPFDSTSIVPQTFETNTFDMTMEVQTAQSVEFSPDTDEDLTPDGVRLDRTTTQESVSIIHRTNSTQSTSATLPPPSTMQSFNITDTIIQSSRGTSNEIQYSTQSSIASQPFQQATQLTSQTEIQSTQFTEHGLNSSTGKPIRAASTASFVKDISSTSVQMDSTTAKDQQTTPLHTAHDITTTQRFTADPQFTSVNKNLPTKQDDASTPSQMTPSELDLTTTITRKEEISTEIFTTRIPDKEGHLSNARRGAQKAMHSDSRSRIVLASVLPLLGLLGLAIILVFVVRQKQRKRVESFDKEAQEEFNGDKNYETGATPPCSHLIDDINFKDASLTSSSRDQTPALPVLSTAFENITPCTPVSDCESRQNSSMVKLPLLDLTRRALVG